MRKWPFAGVQVDGASGDPSDYMRRGSREGSETAQKDTVVFEEDHEGGQLRQRN